MNEKKKNHENLPLDPSIKMGSNRAFGLVFSAVFFIISIWPLLNGKSLNVWAIPPAGIFLLLSITFPIALKPLNIVWFKFGLFLHKIMNPIIMAFLFITTVVPIGLALKFLGKDPLTKGFDSTANSYWINRNPPGPLPDSMKNQF